MRRILCTVLLSFLMLIYGCSRTHTQPGIVKIAAEENNLVITANAPKDRLMQLVEMRSYQRYRPGADLPVVWEGKLSGHTIRIPRFDGKKDRLFSKFQLVESSGFQPCGSTRWVTDLSALPRRNFDFPWPKNSVKGLSCVVMVDDAVKLGVKYVTDNIWFNQAFDLSKAPKHFVEVDGVKVPINTAYFERMDRKVKAMTDARMNVTMVLNNTLPADIAKDHPLHHPWNIRSEAPRPHSAINVTNETALLWYRGLMEYVAKRYSDPNGKHGWISGYIVGNEVQSHWEWYNMGEVEKDDFIEDYVKVLRVTDLAVRKIHSQIRIYVSMDHHWTKKYHKNSLRTMQGDELLEGINALSKSEGDFPWHLAFHPYPEDLFQPRCWMDKTATYSFNTLRITFKNIEVLSDFLQQQEFLYHGKQRRIILSEQGLNQPDEPDGEKVQAAAYAYAYYRVSHTPGIDAFMLHRHVDARGEGGLRLGIWTWDNPRKKKYIYEVFRLADTEQWEDAFEFARPIIGIEKWDQLRPRPVKRHKR